MWIPLALEEPVAVAVTVLKVGNPLPAMKMPLVLAVVPVAVALPPIIVIDDDELLTPCPLGAPVAVAVTLRSVALNPLFHSPTLMTALPLARAVTKR